MPEFTPKTVKQASSDEAPARKARPLPRLPPTPEWVLSLRAKAAAIPGRQGEVARALLSDEIGFQGTHLIRHDRDSIRKYLVELGWRDGVDIAEIPSPEGDLHQALEALIGREGAEFAGRLWRRNLELALALPRGCVRPEGSPPTPGNDPSALVRTKQFGALRIVEQLEPLRVVLFVYSRNLQPLERICRWFGADADLNPLPQIMPDPENNFAITPLFAGQCLDDETDGGIREFLTRLIKKNRNQVSPFGGTAPVSQPAAFLFASHQPSAHAFLAELIVDPDLNEEQREYLLGVSAGYTPEGFAAVLAALDKAPDSVRNGPTVKAALSGWLCLEKDAFAVVNKMQPDFLSLMAASFGDPARREAMFSGSEAEVYAALWALSQREMADCLAKIRDMIATGNDTQKAVSLFFTANNLRVSQYQYEIARPVFADPGSWQGLKDSTHLIQALHCLAWFADGTFPGRLHRLEAPGYAPLMTESRDLFLTWDQTLELYLKLRNIIERLNEAGKDEIGFGGRVILGRGFWSWVSRYEVFNPMINLLAREVIRTRPEIGREPEPSELGKIAGEWGFSLGRNLPFAFVESKRDWLDDRIIPPELVPPPPGMDPVLIRDDLCGFFYAMLDRDNYARGDLAQKVVTDGRHSRRQHQLFMQMFPGSTSYAGKVDFTDPEYQMLEAVLAGSNPQTRLGMFPLFLKRDPAGLEKSLKRLLSNPNPVAGQELLAIVAKRKDDLDYRELYRSCVPFAGGSEDAHLDMAAAQAADETNGYGGLYDATQAPYPFRDLPPPPDTESADAGRNIFGVTAEEVLSLLQAIEKTVDANAAFTYKARLAFGPAVELTIGDSHGIFPEYRLETVGSPNAGNPSRQDRIAYTRVGNTRLDDLPLAPVWRTMLAEARPSPACLVFLAVRKYASLLNPYLKDAEPAWADYGRNILRETGNSGLKVAGTTYNGGALFDALLNEVPADVRYPLLRTLIMAAMAIEPDPSRINTTLPVIMAYLADSTEKNDANFRERFRLTSIYLVGMGANPDSIKMELLRPEDFARACRMWAIPRNDFLRLFVAWGRSHPNQFESFVDPRTQGTLLAGVPDLAEIVDSIGARAMELEAKAGPVPSKLSVLAAVFKKYAQHR